MHSFLAYLPMRFKMVEKAASFHSHQIGVQFNFHVDCQIVAVYPGVGVSGTSFSLSPCLESLCSLLKTKSSFLSIIILETLVLLSYLGPSMITFLTLGNLLKLHDALLLSTLCIISNCRNRGRTLHIPNHRDSRSLSVLSPLVNLRIK